MISNRKKERKKSAVYDKSEIYTYMCARTYAFSFRMINMYSDFTQLDSSYLAGKNRVRSMVNQLNAAVSSTRPTIPSTIPGKRTPNFPPTVNSGRSEPTINSTISTNKTTITSPNRPSLQRAMTIHNNTPLTPSSPPTMNNNISSTYKRR